MMAEGKKYPRSIPFTWSRPTTPEEMRASKAWLNNLRDEPPAKPDPTPQDELHLSLEVSKYYKNQAGDIVKIISEILVADREDPVAKFDFKTGFKFKDESGRKYRENGHARIHPNESSDSPFHLVEEVTP